jgi:hypothetical protein
MIRQIAVQLRTLLLLIFAVLMLWCPSGLPLAGSMMEITELLSHPDYYDRQLVVVVGRVTQVQNGANRQGQPGYGFLLNDEGGSVKVVALGKAEVQEGDQVIVEGVFNRLRQTGRAVVYNEIKATAVRPISRLNPDLVG